MIIYSILLSKQKPQKSKSKPGVRDQLPEEDRTAIGSGKCPVGQVVIYDLSCLLPVQKLLGEHYVYVVQVNIISNFKMPRFIIIFISFSLLVTLFCLLWQWLTSKFWYSDVWSIWFLEVSFFLVFFSFNKMDLVSMCRRNSQAAAVAGRKDLIQVLLMKFYCFISLYSLTALGF